ncbi:hypothetical protein IQ273_01420 [Nodosilinea sp. LEGE 07298]|uniref:hypothetical protein n=1 Tax=Nodosilinea sp. LEGE 07298 TaxID=2777970 RepID=UPI0018824164|nr:hypothetical protein [Nodosilinea sp. LEGE 07298]MBE9108085.1 hypothetical protein [Nodosilinea sp. LEGE 07298]
MPTADLADVFPINFGKDRHFLSLLTIPCASLITAPSPWPDKLLNNKPLATGNAIA